MALELVAGSTLPELCRLSKMSKATGEGKAKGRCEKANTCLLYYLVCSCVYGLEVRIKAELRHLQGTKDSQSSDSQHRALSITSIFHTPSV